MPVPFLRRMLVGLAATASVAGLGGVARAQAAGTPGWHTAQVLRHCGNDSLESVTAVGADDAWAIGAPNWSGSGCLIDLEYWNGQAWRRVAVPRDVGLGLTLGFSYPIAAASGTGAWIFPGLFGHIRNSYFTYNYALHWNGRSWQKSRFPAELIVSQAEDFGPRNVWAFGEVYAHEGVLVPYVARFNGRTWRRVSMPGGPLAVSAVSASDMWAIGPSARTEARPLTRQTLIAMHWDGRRWRTLSVPRVKLAGFGSYFTAANVAADGSGGLWWSYGVTAPSSTAPTRSALLHWHDGRWTTITGPRGMPAADLMTPDGRGGVWLVAGSYWFQYDDGQWGRRAVFAPAGYNLTVFGIAWVPGTTSVWAVGEADKNYAKPPGPDTEAVILKFGR